MEKYRTQNTENRILQTLMENENDRNEANLIAECGKSENIIMNSEVMGDEVINKQTNPNL